MSSYRSNNAFPNRTQKVKTKTGLVLTRTRSSSSGNGSSRSSAARTAGTTKGGYGGVGIKSRHQGHLPVVSAQVVPNLFTELSSQWTTEMLRFCGPSELCNLGITCHALNQVTLHHSTSQLIPRLSSYMRHIHF